MESPITARPYRGRFAPSPTGELHFGSLLSAVASYLDACAHGGEWLLRIEDIDPPREVPGATDAILRALDAHGLQWDGEGVYQSRRLEIYQRTVESLRATGLGYYCACSRKEILVSHGSAVYPGTCRHRTVRSGAVRVRAPHAPVNFEDRIQGPYCQRIDREVGDFVIQRADGLYSYQLAVVIDDAAQGVTHVVRGADLLDSTPRQIHLQSLLGFATPNYAHVPVVVNQSGEKLSKQTGAAPLDCIHPGKALARALELLGQQPPPDAARWSLPEL